MTKRDLRIVTAFYPILVELARSNDTTTYGALAGEAKARHPNDDLIRTLIPRGVARRLSILRTFTDQRAFPDLSSLVLNGNTGEVGRAYSDEYDPLEQRKAVFAFDWSECAPDFRSFVADVELGLTTTKPLRMKRDEAKQALWNYARHQDSGVLLPDSEQREDVLLLIMSGEVVAEAIRSVCDRSTTA